MTVAINDRMLLMRVRGFGFDMVGLLEFDPRCLQCKRDANQQVAMDISQ
jgi:hypothetical protein